MNNEMIVLATALILLASVYAVKKRFDDKNCSINLLEIAVGDLERKLGYKISHIENIASRNRNSLLGARVMCRSNENEPLTIGTVVSFTELSQAKNPFPVVKSEADGEERVVLGIVVPYNEKILAEIKDLQPKEQWDYMVENRLGLRWE